MPKQPDARLKDVAARAGVSIKTVSNVVNDYPYVSDRTRQRVQEAIAELGYQPNAAARQLRRGKSDLIALAVPELSIPYFAELAHHVVQAAAERGWTVLVDETGGFAEREREAALGISANLIDGLLLSPLALSDEEISVHAARTPLVLLGERVSPGLADHVAIDNTAAAREAVEHLLDRGRKRIAVIGSQRGERGRTAELRLQGFEEALAARGLSPDPKLVVPAEEWHRADGAAAVRRLLSRRKKVDAIFCLNDLLALGALRGLQEAGLRVPEDVAVVGFDDIEETRYSSPSLSTVSPDKASLARTALSLLAERIAGGGDIPPRAVFVDHSVQVRESS
ncbi:LacI family DNA-binding transcriptional regulator [Motilibacter rhizosphaerae]|uniref:LacI family DNA-binding transcriptional regulator n=1 Tax=Motilibacter rhizosphaerae TaxID=598652 RepID=UPI001E5D9297|nr:LacI family DNA-binding transcriptional regulator [Motilibacter rhizosphaerae]